MRVYYNRFELIFFTSNCVVMIRMHQWLISSLSSHHLSYAFSDKRTHFIVRQMSRAIPTLSPFILPPPPTHTTDRITNIRLMPSHHSPSKQSPFVHVLSPTRDNI